MFIDILFQIIRNTVFFIKDSYFESIISVLYLFDVSFGDFSLFNVEIASCAAINNYFIYSFNSNLIFEKISAKDFTTGFFTFENTSLTMNHSIFNNSGSIWGKSSKMSLFYLQNQFSDNLIQIENSIFVLIVNIGNGSVI